MNYRYIALLSLSSLFLLNVQPAAAQINIDTSAANHNHRFEYWGTSLAWWANEVGGQSNAQGREELADLFFDAENGLGMNFVRYNIGAGSNPDTSVQNITRPGAKMDGFVPNAPSDLEDPSTWDYDFTQDATQRLVLDMGIERGVTNIEAFANSAPWWMTRNLSSSGADNGGSNLQSNRGGLFAEYMLEVTDHFENNEGIHFETLAPMNEPGSGFWRNGNSQEGMGVPVGAFPFQDRLIKSFGEAIEARGTNIKLVGIEETSTDQSADSWTNSNLTDEAKGYIKQFNTHTYGFNGASQQADNERLFEAVTEADGLQIYATEYGTGQGAGRLVEQIQRDIRYLDAAGWTYWQALEDNNGSGWGLGIANFNGSNDEYDIQDQYFAFKQLSAHIRPGSEIIELPGNAENGNITAAYDPRTGQTVLVVNNQDDQATSEEYSFNLDRNVASTRLIRTTDENNSSITNAYQSLANANVNGNNVTFDSIGESVTTLVVNHRENLIRNGNFDLAGAANGATSISDWQSSGDAAFDTGSDHTFDITGTGTGRLETEAGKTEGRIFQTGIGDADVDLTGIAYQLSADVRFLNAGNRQYDADTYLALEFYGADDQTLASISLEDYETEINPAPGVKPNGSNSSVQGSDPNDNEYRTYVSGRFVAPEGTRYVRPVIRFDNQEGENGFFTFVDNVSLQEVHPEAAAREWHLDGDGEWSDNDNWSNNAQVENNKQAYFGNSINSDSEIFLTGDQAVSGVTFFSENSYTLDGGVGALAGALLIGESGSDDSGKIDVRMGDHLISVETALMNNLDLQVLPESLLTFDDEFDVSGFNLRKLGSGAVEFLSGFLLNGGTLSSYASDDANIFFGDNTTLDGDFELLIAPGQILELGDMFELAEYASLSDTFDAFVLPELSDEFAWDINYGDTLLTAAVVSATAVPEPSAICVVALGLLTCCGRRRRSLTL